MNSIASLSVERIEAEFDRMTEVALSVNHGDKASKAFAATEKLLEGWRGDAAVEFAAKLGNLAQHLELVGGVCC